MERIDNNIIEHHMMIAELLLSGKFNGEITELEYRETSDEVTLRHFSEAYVNIEDMIYADDGMATGVTCVVGEREWDAFLDTCYASSEEVLMIERDDVAAILWENVYVIPTETASGILTSYVDNHGDQHVVKSVFSS